MVRDRGSVRRARRTAAAVAAVCGALLLAGACSSPSPTPKPLDTPTKSASRTPTAAPTKTPATTPSGEKPEQAFVRSYVDAWNVALKTGDVERLRSMEAANCTQCKGTIAWIEKRYADGGRFLDDPSYQFGGWASEPEGTHPVVVTLYLSNKQYRYREKAGGPVKTIKAQKSMLFRAELSRSGSGWKMEKFFQWES